MGAPGLAVTTLPVAELTPYPGNPRIGDVPAIAASLEANGQYRPIVATAAGVVLAGNHVLAAARRLGWSHVEVVTLELDADSDAARRIVLADNRTADLAEYDPAALAELLAALSESDGELEGSGWEADELAELLEGVTDELAAQLARAADADGRGYDTTGMERVPFRFGDHAGAVARPVYVRWVEAYNLQRAAGVELLEDMLSGWFPPEPPA